MVDVSSGGGPGRRVVIGIALAVAGLGLAAWMSVQAWSSSNRKPKVHFVCESCGHEWDAPTSAQPACPKCGAKPLLKTYFRCPKCQNVWLGLERQKLGPGKFRYRLPGSTEWLTEPPFELTCPTCKLTSNDLYRHALRAQPGKGPAAGTAAPDDRPDKD